MKQKMDKQKHIKKVLVHLHLFYYEKWIVYEHKLRAVDETSHMILYITYISLPEELKITIQRIFPQVVWLCVENRGFDVGPFVEVIRRVNLLEYDYVVKLHTKKTYSYDWMCRFNKRYPFNIRKWDEHLLLIVKNDRSFRYAIEALEKDQRLGMIADHRLIMDSRMDDQRLAPAIVRIAKEMGLSAENPYYFVAGSMFIARASILLKIKELNYRIDDFCLSDSQASRDMVSLAHAFERIFGLIVSEQGFQLRDVLTWRVALVYKVCLNFTIQRRITASGRNLIRLFGFLPVWWSRTYGRRELK